MENIDELLEALRQGTDTTEDKTAYIRKSPRGDVVDFEIIERTNFSGAYPETVKEFRTQEPLPCGHPISRNNPFSGYCQGRRRNIFLQREVCAKEYCSLCAVQCSKCGLFVSVNCCAREYEGLLYCVGCHRKLMCKHLLSRLSAPFLAEDLTND